MCEKMEKPRYIIRVLRIYSIILLIPVDSLCGLEERQSSLHRVIHTRWLEMWTPATLAGLIFDIESAHNQIGQLCFTIFYKANAMVATTPTTRK